MYWYAAFLVALIVPLLTGTWRIRLWGLSLQGLAMGALAMQQPGETLIDFGLTFVDLFVIRATLVPIMFFRVQRAIDAPRRDEVLPANLLFWTVAAALVFAAFQFAGLMAPAGQSLQLQIAVVASAVLLSFLALATARSMFGQAVGILGLENGIALLELVSPRELPLALRAAVLAIYVVTAGILAAFLRSQAEPATVGAAEEEATL